MSNTNSVNFDDIDESYHSIRRLSYEEAIKKLDILITELQSDLIPIEQLQRQTRQAKLYLDHCENLLNTVEQKIIQLNPITLEPENIKKSID